MRSVVTNYTALAGKTTDFTAPTKPTSDWGLELRHTYGAEAGETTHILLGDHVRYGGIAMVTYRFIDTNYTE